MTGSTDAAERRVDSPHPEPGGRGRGPTWSRRRLAAALAITVAAPLITLLVCDAVVVLSTRERIHESPADVSDGEVAIVLGARVTAGGRPTATLADRLTIALELYRAGKVSRILVSGDHATSSYDETGAMLAWLVAAGVPARDVFLDHAGLRTLDTMERARRVFGVRRAVVCTQRFHLPRALFLADAAGIDAVGVVADRRRYLGERWNTVRETLARAGAVADRWVLGTEPRFLGPQIPIEGDGTITHDTRAPLPVE